MKKAETQQAIIRAAKNLFVANGYKGTTTLQIAQKAGISEMTLFRHFPSKDDIFLKVINPVISFVDNLEISEQSDLYRTIQDVFENRLQFLIEERELVRLVVLESFLGERDMNPVNNVVDKLRRLFVFLKNDDRELVIRLLAGFILANIFLPEPQTDNRKLLVNFLEKVICPVTEGLSEK